jgi:ParB-like chromosome segregation protein Spo0J
MPEIGKIAISDIKPYKKNARTHPPAQIEKLRASLREFGFVNPVLIDKDDNLISGHGRIMAAKAEGMKEVPFYRYENLTDTQRRAYIMADNRLAELSGWDDQLTKSELDDLLGQGFNIDAIGFEFESEDEKPDTEPTEEEIRPYKRMHVLVSCDASRAPEVIAHINQLKEIEGVEIDHAFN